MVWVLLGLLAGGGWVALTRSVPVLAGPSDTLVTAICGAGARFVGAAVHGLGMGADTQLESAAAALAGVLSPGLVCLAVAEAAVISAAARRAAAVLLTVAAFSSFAVLPGPAALTLCVAVLVLNALLGFGRGVVVLFPLAAGVGVIAGTVLTWVGHSARPIRTALAELDQVGGDPTLWRIALLGVAVAGCAAGALLMVRRA